VLTIFIHPLYAQSSLYTDRSGYTTGTQDGRIVNTYTDRYGNTSGWVGGKYQSTYSDGYGGTTGSVGNKRVNTYDDGYGNTTGTIGRDRINLHTDRSGEGFSVRKKRASSFHALHVKTLADALGARWRSRTASSP
jgi:hypothetical protein